MVWRGSLRCSIALGVVAASFLFSGRIRFIRDIFRKGCEFNVYHWPTAKLSSGNILSLEELFRELSVISSVADRGRTVTMIQNAISAQKLAIPYPLKFIYASMTEGLPAVEIHVGFSVCDASSQINGLVRIYEFHVMLEWKDYQLIHEMLRCTVEHVQKGTWYQKAEAKVE